ncbi:MAG TPA: chemotaxis protein CheA [Polyangia bacterium]|nr:chemotaxis protein CheA [Polyangia bacterium]
MTDRFDAAEFIAGFIAEAEEHLTSANANLLSAEEAAANGQPTPRQVRELFRSFHTLKGLAAMVGVDPIVDVAHAMESVLRDADRAAGTLPRGAVELLLNGIRVIEQGVRALAKKKPVPEAPPALLAALGDLQKIEGQQPAAGDDTTLPADLWAKLSAAERQQLVQGLLAGRRALLVLFRPTPERAAAGTTITTVRERVAQVAEIVKVVPRSQPTTADAPAGLAFALVVLSAVDDAVIAEATAAAPDDLTPIRLEAPPAPIASAMLGIDGVDDEDLRRRGFVRVEVRRLDDALERLSALVVTQFRLVRAAAALREAGADTRALAQVVSENGRQLRDLRAAIMRARMVSVAEVLERVPLIVRGLSRATGKAARLELSAGHAELDKAVAERIFPAVVHLVRNAVDHALEPPEERRAAGKPEVGLVRVACFERSDSQLELTVSDDGRGIDAAAVARRAGTALPATPEALLDLLTRPGLSTKSEVTETSGRGMGMDVVKRVAVEELRGELSMTTAPGQGTTFTLRIPLSITIVDAFSFACGGETFVVPVSTVEEIRDIDLTKTVRGPDRRQTPRRQPDRRRVPRASDMIERRGEAVPVLRLDDLLGLPTATADHRKAIVVRRNGEPFAFVVDRMIGQQEIVVRPIEDPFVRVAGVAGTTDLGDGRPTLVLDLASLGDGLMAGGPKELRA